MERLLSYKSLKAELTLSEATVRRLIAAGRFPKPQFVGARAVFPEGAVQAAVAKLLSDRPGPGFGAAR